MLLTLAKIGEQLLEGQGIWSRLTIEPKVTEGKNHWACPILFDCDSKKMKFLDLIRYYASGDEDVEPSAIRFRYVNPDLWGRRGKKCALTVEPKNFTMLQETFFGKGSSGSPVLQSMTEFDSSLQDTELYQVIQLISDEFAGAQDRLDLQVIKEHYRLGGNDEIVLFYSLVKSEKIRDGEQVKLADLGGYEEFFIGKFGTPAGLKEGLDYVNGLSVENSLEANFTGRYNIHKTFQTTTYNYASGFEGFSGNFRSSPETLAALDKASEYVLKNMNTYIAGIPHIIVPNFLNKDLKTLDLSEIEQFIFKSNEFLFQLPRVKDLAEDLEVDSYELFWINYVAFESDGNSFKVINHIKDVNSHYLLKLIKTLKQSERAFQPYLQNKFAFTFQMIYGMVPVREQKAKKNEALILFKAILEQHPIDETLLYKHFIQLIKCHWSGQFNDKGRHRTFGNIRKIESFDFAVRDACIKYHLLFSVLKELKLIDMEENSETLAEPLKPQEATSEFQKKVQEFFAKMNYPPEKQAMFYLGRVLSQVAYAQYKKKHESKPVLNKVNFNGMDVPAVMRLSLDLSEKTRQYNIHYTTDWDFARFREIFNEDAWTLSSEQNVFYLMTGYSFGLTASKDMQPSNDD